MTAASDPVLTGPDRARAQFRAAFGVGVDAVLADQDGTVLDVVGPLATDLLRPGAQLVDLPDEWASDDLATALAAVLQDHLHTVTAHLVDPDGRSLRIRLFTVIGDDHERRYVVGSLGPDVDDEEVRRLRRAERRYELVFDRLPTGVALVDVDGRFLRANPAFCRIVGRSEEELCRCTFADITHPDDVDVDVARAREVLDGVVDHYSIEKRYLRPDGSIVWVRLTVAGFEVDGTIDHFVSMVEDITDRRATETLLERALALQQATFEHAAVAMAEATLDAVIVRANAAAGSLFGCRPTDLVGVSTPDLIADADQRDDARSNLSSLFAGNRRPLRRERRVVDRGGRERWLSVHSAAVLGPDGEPERLILQAIDITEAHSLRRQLEQSVEGLSQAFREKVGLMSALSHDLRAPLAAIRIMAQLLAEGDGLDPDRRDLTSRILTEAERTEALLGDLVASERAGAGLVAPRRVPVDLGTILDRIARVHQGSGRTVVVERRTDDTIIRGDPALLERLVDNLVANAVRHTPPTSSVWLSVGDTTTDVGTAHAGPTGRAPSSDVVVLCVDDDGPGVPASLKEQVFDPFVRGHHHDRPGSGIGLFLVREFAEHHGGTATYLDRPGGGARFRIELPR